MKYEQMSSVQRKELLSQLTEKYNEYCARGLKLDLSRGKPNSDQ